MGRVPEEALLLVATKRMLYEQDMLSVGVGLMYKPHYVSMESFCSAYMHLNVWHAAASSEDNRQIGFHPLHTGLHLGDEQGGAGRAAAPRLPGHVRQGGHGENWRTTGSSLVSGFQAPYCVESATWRGACLSDRLPLPLRGCHCTNAGV